MPDNIFQVSNVYKKHHVKGNTITALDGLSLDIRRGSIIGIIGKSGAGKSSLLRCLNGLEHPDFGQVLYKGEDITTFSQEKLSLIRQEIGMIFQHFNLLSRRTAQENVALALELTGVAKVDALKKAKKCLELVGLGSRCNAYPSELSGGQKQRVAIARALANDAKVLLCDEATSALDARTTEEILHFLKDLNRKLGITIVMITHEIAVVRDICHYVVVMDSGKILEGGTIEKIFSSPQNQITQTLIESLVNSRVPEVVSANILKSPPPGKSEVVLHFLFTGESAQKPIIAHLIQEHCAHVNILSGYIDHIGNTNFGTLIVTLPNDEAMLKNVFHFLNQHHVDLKILGYLAK